MILWMNEAPERDAMFVHNTLKKGKKKLVNQLQVLTELVCVSSPNHLMAVRQAYCSSFQCSLEEDITSNISNASLQKVIHNFSPFLHAFIGHYYVSCILEPNLFLSNPLIIKLSLIDKSC